MTMIKRCFFYSVAIIFCCLILLTCVKKQKPTKRAFESTWDKLKSNKTKITPIFNQVERNQIKKIQQKGKIIAGARFNRINFQSEIYQTQPSFNYLLLKSFADEIGVQIEVKPAKFDDYFSINGRIPEKVKTDQNYSYTPDLIKNVDIIVDLITVLPWRKKLLRFIKILPTVQVIIGRKENSVSQLKHLIGKRVSVTLNSSYYDQLEQIKLTHQILFPYLIVDTTSAMIEAVQHKKAHFTLLDLNIAFFYLRQYQELMICFPVSKIQNLGWAVNKNDEILALIIEKYVEYAYESGLINQLWVEYYNITLDEYFDFLKY